MQDSTNRKREVDHGCAGDSDSDYLEVLSPPNKRCVRSASPIPSNYNNDDEEEDAVVLSSNLVNPNIDYPHLRLNCGKIAYSSETASQFCGRCFCHVCDRPAMVCESWAQHCLQIPVQRDTSISTGEVTVLGSSSVGANVFLQNRRGVVQRPYPNNTPATTSPLVAFFQQHYGVPEGGGRGMPYSYDGGDNDDDIYGSVLGSQRRGRGADSKRITEVLAENLALLVNFTDDPNVDQELRRRLTDEGFLQTLKMNKDGLRPTPMAANLKMEGDISDLRLHNSFFVEGIRIGWPFSTILTPQRQMAIHIVKALKRKLHVVLESPTGTGKSAAILCSVLAWQRYHAKCQLAKPPPQPSEEEKYGDDETAKPKDTRDRGEIAEPNVVTIIYCSRTHSQVAQMVSSLQKTPYRPRMTILGSRERLCINKELTKGDKKPTNAVLNQKCRDRKMETDRRRKVCIKDLRNAYDDDNPVEFTTIGNSVDESTRTSEQDGEDSMDNNSNRRGTKRLTCQHYQQLTTFRTAMAVRDRFIKAADEVNSCCSGGEHTKLGVMDIEDLADFGKNPHRDSKIALYRSPPNTGSFGIFLAQRTDGPGCQVEALRPGGVAEKDGRIMVGDWIQALNGISTKSWTLEQIKQRILNSTKDPLILAVQREGAPTREDELDLDNNEEPYSDHSVCPYYLSRALLPSANLIFAPYNYVLDPAIRRTMSLNLEGSVVVLDEAHNIEDTLCESGSGAYGEIDLCNLISTLTRYSNQKDGGKESAIELVSGGQQDLSSVAHELLLFLEKLVKYMQQQRRNFETGPAVEKIKQDHVRYKLQDDHVVEISFSGPTGFGLKNKAVGCGPKLVDLGITAEQCKRMSCLAQSLENHLFGKSDAESDPASEAAMNNLNDIMSRFELASRSPEHFLLAFNMKPNGNMNYATKLEETQSNPLTGTQRMRKQPRPLPLASPRTEKQPNVPLNECHHEGCTNKDSRGYIIASRKGIRHGDMCNGDIPLWECHLTIRLLFPGLLMNDLSRKCRSVILASGSLAPLQSLCAELNLYGPKLENSSTATPGEFPLSQSSSAVLGAQSNTINLLTPSSQDTPIPKYPATMSSPASTTKPKKKELSGRLQVKPKPLEAGHVIDLKKQLLACAIGHFPDGTPLTVSYANYKEDSFFPRLGHALASVIENIPFGGVLVFLPSYSFLNKCIKCWNPATFGEPGSKTTIRCPEIWNRFLQAKGKVIVEPTGSQEKFDAARLDYQDQIRREKRCLLLAVFRGKMSEGISFNDDNARAVICIGIPYPNSFDRNIRAKKAYNDEQRKFCNNNNLLPGQEWYSQQAYRAIAQALGRCIRHGADYGAVILMDSRQCDDGSPNGGIPTPHRNLPVWMRHTVRTLSMRPHGTSGGGGGGGGVGVDPILGGYKGLAQELQRFFVQAPVHSQTVLDKWKLDLETAQNKCRDNEGGRTFDGVTGQWQDDSITARSTSSACVGSVISSSVVKTEL